MADEKYSVSKMYFGKDLTLYAVWETLEISQVNEVALQGQTEGTSFTLTSKNRIN